MGDSVDLPPRTRSDGYGSVTGPVRWTSARNNQEKVTEDPKARRMAEEAALRYETIFNRAGWGMAIADPETHVLTQHNEAFARMHGYGPGEMVGMLLSDTLAPEARGDLAAHAQTVHRNGHHIYEAVHVRKDGSRFPCLTDVTAYRDETGKVVFRAATLEDITERKQVEEALRESENRFRTVFEQAAVGMAQVETGTGRFVRVNQRYCEIAGYTADELLAQDFQSITHPDDLPEDLRNLERLRSGEIREYAMEKRYVGKDGSVSWVRLTVSPMWAPGEVPNYNIAVVENISGRKSVEKALHESEERQRLAVEAAKMGTFDWNVEKDELIWSRRHEALFGYGPGEFGGTYQDFARRIHPEDLPELEAEVDRCIEARSGFAHEFRVVWPDGSVHWMDATGEFTFGPDGKPLRMHGVVMETTEKRLADAALEDTRNHLSALMDSVDGIVWEADADSFRCTFVSPGAERLLGHERARWTEEPTFWIDHIHPEDRERTVRFCKQQTAALCDHEFEYRMRAADGRYVWLRDVVSVVEENGEAVKLRGIMLDITAQKRSEEERNQIFQRITDAFVALDKDWNYTFVNEKAGKIMGRDARSLIGRNIWNELPDAYGLMFHQTCERAMIDQKPAFLEEYCPPLGGWFENRIYPSPEGLSIYFHDITKRKLAEQKLADSRDQLRALLARLQRAREDERVRVSREIHDELGQLLTSLKMDVRWLEGKLSDSDLPPSLNSLLDRAVSASELADATIATVQKIAAELRPGALDHLGLAAALAQEARRFEERSGISCTFSEDGTWGALPVEVEGELYYIVQEALTNVARHSNADRVDVFLRSEGNKAVVEVRDDGVGISKDALDESASLGLLGMEERAAQCGGEIRITRNEPHGTRVVVKIPRPGTGRTQS